MPYVDISTGTDYASLWYITNSPTGTVGGFDPAKPTVIMLHPIFLDSTWLYAQFDDGTPVRDAKQLQSCFVCHQAVGSRDYVITKYAR